MKRNSFFSRKEQSEFIQRVYRETPATVQSYFKKESELLSEALSNSMNVLEVGCGFGRALSHFDSRMRYTGVDIGFNYVLEANSLYPGRDWLCANGTQLPFLASVFDAVFCIQNTLGNMEGIEASVVEESKRVIRKGGKLIVSVYSEDSFEVRRLWYDRLIDIGIFRRIWLDQANPKIVRSDTGWSSRCFDKEEVKIFFTSRTANLEITKLDSFLYFCVAELS